MASGNYARKSSPQAPIELTTTRVPARATRQLTRELPETVVDRQEQEQEQEEVAGSKGIELSRTLPPVLLKGQSRPLSTYQPRRIVTEFPLETPIQHHKPWLQRWVISAVLIVVALLVLISAGMFQRPGDTHLLTWDGGQSYDIQVGGSLSTVNKWQSANTPLPIRQEIKSQSGPYSVIGKPTITVDFINKVLATYHSPAAGKGQILYNLGVDYGIDPAFALAFFMHESSFGTKGEAAASLSLGNLRCINNFKCQDGYAWFDTWDDGFREWYKLIRNLYVSIWGRTTIEQIIPKYAPQADHNDEQAYIASLKHALDTWRAGVVTVS